MRLHAKNQEVKCGTDLPELSRCLYLNPVRRQRYNLDRKSRQRDRAGVGRQVRAEQWAERVDALPQYLWELVLRYHRLERRRSALDCQERWAGG